jgi:transposase
MPKNRDEIDNEYEYEEEEIEESSNDEIEINDKPKKQRKTRSDKKPPKEKAPYVYTEKRQTNIQKAIEARKLKVEMRKQEQQEMNQLYLKEKQRLEDQKFVKIKKKQHQELQKLKKEVSKYDESSSEEEVVIMKKPKKKVVYIEKPERPVEKQQLPAPTPIRKYVAYM